MASTSFLQAFYEESKKKGRVKSIQNIVNKNVGKSTTGDFSFYDTFASLENPKLAKKITNRYNAQTNALNKGLDAGLSWEAISKQTGIPLQRVQSFSEANRPGYGVQPTRSVATDIKGAFADRAKSIVNPSVALAKSAGSALLDLPKDIAQRAGHLGGTLFNPNYQTGNADKIIAGQEKAKQLPADMQKKVSANILVQDRVKALEMINNGASAKELSKFIDESKKRKSNLDKRTAGAALEASSYAFGGGNLYEAFAKGGAKALLSSAAGTTASGAAGGAGYELRTNPEASGKQIAQSAGTGAAFGLGSSLVSSAAGGVVRKFKAGSKIPEIPKIENPVSVTPTGLAAPSKVASQATPAPVPVSGLQKIATDKVTNSGGLIDKLKAKASRAYTKTIDQYNPIIKAGRQAGQEEKIQNALAGHYGSGSTANYHVDFELSPIFKGVDSNDFKSLLIANRDLELAGRGIKGSSAEAANQSISKLQNKYGEEGLSALQGRAQQLYDYQKNLVNTYLVDTGVMSKDAAKAMFAKNQKYIPFKRVQELVDEKLGISGANSAASVGSQNVIKAIKGSNKQIVDPVESILENTYKIVGLGKRNAAATALTDLSEKVPGLLKKVSKAEPNQPTVSVFRNGKKVVYATTKDIADAAKGLEGDQLGTLAKIFAAPTRVFRETATGINPEFGPKNVVRDLQTAFITTGVHPLDFVKGFAHYMKKDDLYQDFLKSGALTTRLTYDNPALKKTAAQVTGKRGIRILSPKRLYNALEKVGEASEVPTRLAAFQKTLKKELKKGVPREEAIQTAARAGQESTVNFARRGAATKSVNAVYAFMNARAQGTDRLLRAIKKNPKTALSRLGLITIGPSLSLYAYNRTQDNYFDPRVVSDYDKRNNFIIMAPWLGKDKFIKIPKGDVGRLANPLEAFLEHLDNKGDTSIASEITQSLKAFLPVDNAGDVLPTATRPIAQQVLNRNFFMGNEIVPDWKKNYPKKLQDQSATAPLYRALGDLLNQSPARLQDLGQGYLTGFSRIAENATSPLLPDKYKTDKNKQGDTINRVPVLRNFVGGAKKSPEEYATGLAKYIASMEFAKIDIKSGVNRGELTREQGDRQLQKIQDQQDVIRQKAEKDGYGQLLTQVQEELKRAALEKARATRYGY